MPKSNTETLPLLKPYDWHGLRLKVHDHLGEAVGDCPFCGKEGKFYVSLDTGKWQCKRCSEGNVNGGGNAYTFLNLLHQSSETTEDEYAALAEDRGLLFIDTVEAWGCRKSLLSGEWVVPAYNADGVLAQLYTYRWDSDAAKMVLYATPCLDPKGEDKARHGLFGLCAARHHPDEEVDWLICEGPWDGMALDEVLQADPERSDRDVVIAVPGCNVWVESWAKLLKGRKVTFLFDNDHPLKHPKKAYLIEPAAHSGVRRAVCKLAASADRPDETYYLRWAPDDVEQRPPEERTDWDECYEPSLPHGYDVRDHLLQGATVGERTDLLGFLLRGIKPTPSAWLSDIAPAAKDGKPRIEPLTCTDWRTLRDAWKCAFKWTDGLDRALTATLAAVISTETIGEPLWILMSSPPSTGKTSVCEGLSVSERYVHPRSELRSIYSGYKTDSQGAEDHSLVEKIRGKTLVIKDADPVLKSPNRGLILGQLRDLYDGMSRSHFNNGMSRAYENVRTTIILCGTAALLELDAAEMGARFLSIVIMEKIDVLFEREVNRRVFRRALRNVKIIANGKPETQRDADLIHAQRLTGGYVEYLRKNAERLLGSVSVRESLADQVCSMAEFVALIRARPPKHQNEVTEREFSPRLVEQMTRFMTCTAAVMGKDTVDDEVLRRVRQAATDTARGKTLDIARLLHENHEDGMEVAQIAHHMREDEKKMGWYMRFLSQLDVAEWSRVVTSGRPSKPVWRLTDRVRELYREVIGDESHEPVMA